MSTGMEELDVEEHCWSMRNRCLGLWDLTGKQEAKLMLLDSDRLQKVCRLSGLDCKEEPIWAQQLLEQLAPQLEELQLWNVQHRHLRCLEHMPKLKRLQVEGWDDELASKPFFFQQRGPNLPALQFLHVSLPRETTFSLLAAHGQSLKELELYVSLRLRINGRSWVCKDLPNSIASHGMGNLSGLVLRRGDERGELHMKAECEAQIKSLQTKMPWVKIFCDICAKIPW